MIDSFQGEYRFLSNFWPATVWLDCERYPSVEHAYVAAKTLDLSARCRIRKIDSPGKVKREGRKLALREDWEAIKLSVMLNLVRQKFQHSDLAKLLIETGDQDLVEGNAWGDTFWGVCRGVGQNNLGKILIQVRKELANA